MKQTPESIGLEILRFLAFYEQVNGLRTERIYNSLAKYGAYTPQSAVKYGILSNGADWLKDEDL